MLSKQPDRYKPRKPKNFIEGETNYGNEKTNTD